MSSARSALSKLTADLPRLDREDWWRVAPFGVLVLALLPTFYKLSQGPWETEQDGHGPFILAAALWIAWQSRGQLPAVLKPAPFFGWLSLIGGLAMLYLGRSQDILLVEVSSQIPILAGLILLAAGWRTLWVFAFPLFLLIFTIPPPGWLMDAVTVPLKAMISDVVVRMLYWFGYPVAQNGVVIMIGAYRLLVKDACAGMNSIFALSAISFLYVHFAGERPRWHQFLLIAATLPVAIAANFIRVVALVLIAYHFGPSVVEGLLHNVTGLVLFALAVILLIVLDIALGTLSLLWRRVRRGRRPATKPREETATAVTSKEQDASATVAPRTQVGVSPAE